MRVSSIHSEALPVYNLCSLVLYILLCDPHVLEFVNQRQDSTTQPARIFPVCGCLNLWSHWRRSECLNFLLHSIFHSLEHRTPSCQHNIFEEVFPNIIVALDDAVVCVLMDTVNVFACQLRLEKKLWAPDSLFF